MPDLQYCAGLKKNASRSSFSELAINFPAGRHAWRPARRWSAAGVGQRVPRLPRSRV